MEDFFDNELGRRVLALTKAGFKVSDLIPDMALREKIKHQILAVYKIFFEKKYPELLKELDVLDGFFFLAGHLNLAKEEHVKTLRNGLLVFKSQIIIEMHPRSKFSATDFPQATERKPEKPSFTRALEIEEKRTALSLQKDNELSDRQEKILKYFKEGKDVLKLADLLTIFPDVNEKTVRNDLIFLIKIGKISRQGTGSGSHYRLLEK
ncbi:MAG: hypothetical protein HYW79_02225 [Parcubacteria group bacterium]|nr:hypothetical protein [Parcubacteria group bacterium]